MSGHCDGCDRFALRLWRKGRLWFCDTCLGREL